MIQQSQPSACLRIRAIRDFGEPTRLVPVIGGESDHCAPAGLYPGERRHIASTMGHGYPNVGLEGVRVLCVRSTPEAEPERALPEAT